VNVTERDMAYMLKSMLHDCFTDKNGGRVGEAITLYWRYGQHLDEKQRKEIRDTMICCFNVATSRGEKLHPDKDINECWLRFRSDLEAERLVESLRKL